MARFTIDDQDWTLIQDDTGADSKSFQVFGPSSALFIKTTSATAPTPAQEASAYVAPTPRAGRTQIPFILDALVGSWLWAKASSGRTTFVDGEA
jgi:hypothetical protein